jgi:hypothetical protein
LSYKARARIAQAVAKLKRLKRIALHSENGKERPFLKLAARFNLAQTRPHRLTNS